MNSVRGERLALAVAVAAATALGVGAGSADATWPGSQNGRILLTNGFTRQVVSVCPDATSMVVHRSLAVSPDASPDGKTFAFRGGPSDDASTWGVWLRDFATGAETRVSGPGGMVETGDEFDPNGRGLGFPRFSADGKRLAVQAAWTERQPSGAYEGWGRPALVNLETGAYTLLDGGRDKTVRQFSAELAWSPDETKIFFIGQRLVNGNYTGSSLFSVSTGNGEPVLIDSSRDYGTLDFSPDGTKLLAGTDAGLVEMGPDGGGGRVLANSYSGVYSPDGKKIAYSVGDSSTGHNHLWTMDADGTDARDEGLHWIGLQPEAWSSNVDGCGADETHGGMRVNEVMVAKGSDPAAQFVELLGAADHPFPAADGPYGIAVFDAGNVRVAQHNFPADFLPGRDTSKEILISNAAADSALGATGDYHTDLPLSLPTSAGRVCFTAKNGEVEVSCVAYGCFSPPSLPATDYAPLPPTEQSIQRQGVSSTIWRIASPTPKFANTAGSAGTNCIPPPGGGDGGDGGGGGDDGGGSGGGPGTVTPPQLVDTSGPIFAVPPTNKRLRLTRSGVLRFVIGPAAENVTGVTQFKTDKRIRLKRRGKKRVITFGTASFQALKGQQVAARIRIAKRYRRYLERARELEMQVNITARDLAGNATIKSFNFTLQAPRRKQRN